MAYNWIIYVNNSAPDDQLLDRRSIARLDQAVTLAQKNHPTRRQKHVLENPSAHHGVQRTEQTESMTEYTESITECIDYTL